MKLKLVLGLLAAIFLMSAMRLSSIFKEAEMRREDHSEQFLEQFGDAILFSDKIPYKNGTLSWDSGNQAVIYNNGWIDSLIFMDYPPRTVQTRIARRWESQDVPKLTHNSPRFKYYRELLPAARYLEAKYNIPIRVTLAQASIETGDGRVTDGDNHFGMKMFKSSKTTSMYQKVKKADLAYLHKPILKHDDCCTSKKCNKPDKFYNFKSLRHQWDARALLLTGDRYKSLLSDNYPAYQKYRKEYVWAWQLKIRGYATAPYYANAIIARVREMDKYDL